MTVVSTIVAVISTVAAVLSVSYAKESVDAQVHANEIAAASAKQQAEDAQRASSAASEDANAAQERDAALGATLSAIDGELRSSGPMLSSVAWYTLWKAPMAAPWVVPTKYPALIYPPDDAWQTWLNIEIVNDGRFKATITNISLKSDEQSWAPASRLECLDRTTDRFGVCTNVVVDVQESVRVRVRLDAESRAAVCNPANDASLHYRIETRGADSQEGSMWQNRSCIS